MGKVMTTADAIGTFVGDGDFLFIGGYICRPPFSAIHEIIRQKKRGLTITRSNAADDFDMLVGAGCVKRSFRPSYRWDCTDWRGATVGRSEKGIPHKIELEEYTNLSLPLMLMAARWACPSCLRRTW